MFEGHLNRQKQFDYIFMNVAIEMSKASTCSKAQVGAAITKGNTLIATGYNGAPSKTDHCTDFGCYEVDGHCVRTVHAEINAILQCAKNGSSTSGATIYCTHKPCLDCTQAIINAGIAKVVYTKDYESDSLREEQLMQAGVELIWLKQ